MKHLIKIFSILLIALVAIVNCRHRSLADRADWIAKRISSELDLNDKQKAELQRIKKEILDKRKELDVKLIPEEIIDQIRLTQIDEGKVNKAFETSGTKRDQMRIFMTKKFIEFHAVLTPEQRNKLADRISELLKKHSHD
jgi:periplasmic protein CpxP/Spy